MGWNQQGGLTVLVAVSPSNCIFFLSFLRQEMNFISGSHLWLYLKQLDGSTYPTFKLSPLSLPKMMCSMPYILFYKCSLICKPYSSKLENPIFPLSGFSSDRPKVCMTKFSFKKMWGRNGMEGNYHRKLSSFVFSCELIHILFTRAALLMPTCKKGALEKPNNCPANC